MKTDIRSVTIQIARPMGNDPGTIEQSHYFVDKGVVVLCQRDGTPLTREGLRVCRRRDEPPPLTRWERKLRPDEEHRHAARELLMSKYNATKRGSDFLRPLIYPPSGIA